jgi:hypothetical protein
MDCLLRRGAIETVLETYYDLEHFAGLMGESDYRNYHLTKADYRRLGDAWRRYSEQTLERLSWFDQPAREFALTCYLQAGSSVQAQYMLMGDESHDATRNRGRSD